MWMWTNMDLLNSIVTHLMNLSNHILIFCGFAESENRFLSRTQHSSVRWNWIWHGRNLQAKTLRWRTRRIRVAFNQKLGCDTGCKVHLLLHRTKGRRLKLLSTYSRDCQVALDILFARWSNFLFVVWKIAAFVTWRCAVQQRKSGEGEWS